MEFKTQCSIVIVLWNSRYKIRITLNAISIPTSRASIFTLLLWLDLNSWSLYNFSVCNVVVITQTSSSSHLKYHKLLLFANTKSLLLCKTIPHSPKLSMSRGALSLSLQHELYLLNFTPIQFSSEVVFHDSQYQQASFPTWASIHMIYNFKLQ